MTKEIAIDILDDNFTVIDTHGHYTDEEVEQARQMAIEALEEQQNPNSIRINFVGEKEAKEFNEYLKNQQESILDKIKAEIEQKCCITVGRENEPAITLYDVFQIIDKYMAESEGKECQEKKQ